MPETDAIQSAGRIPIGWFDLYLRTGETPWEVERDVEVKFNPWHDLTSGRFTFRGQGTWTGDGFTGGGGGSFGGGGAQGSWDKPVAARAGKSSQRKVPSTDPAFVAAKVVAAASTASAQQSHIIVRNGYSYKLDSTDRTIAVTGTLTLSPDRQRSRSAQAGAGGSDRLSTDDGGHYIAARFNGPIATFNHFAQDANFNRGGYRVLEDKWAKDIKSGKQVYVSITPSYTGSSRRPSTINVVYSVDGQRGSRLFGNNPKGEPHGK